MKHIFPFIIVLVLFSACDEDIKPLEFKTHNIDTAYEANITVAFDEAVKNKELSETANKTIENAILTTVNSSENASDLQTILKNFNDEYLQFTSDYPEDSEPVWELSIETELTYQSEEIITIAISTYEFKGGAHGNDQIKLLNLDAKTGEALHRSSIINDIDGFTTLAESQFMASLENNKDHLNIENFFFGKPFQLPENIGFSEEGIILIYNVYEVASYDMGYTEFMISFEEAMPYLKKH
ncbi:DUF3298 and DUF4163 domain-containing protein [Winogradskyella ludwigii]|uniref:DUF3298 and DUF4163 domain-containing protein n=1 Tax=Winogradskyella ludwigii TaxID=2686076 RepID=UPI0015C7674A|nr:DUF3298 and DUF4163 domain-containing protein [Winogradskyella ludwigii]